MTTWWGGKFTRAGTTNTSNLARWDGTNWNAFGTGATFGFDSFVCALAALPDGGFLVGGGFGVVDGVVRANFAHWGCPLPPPGPVISKGAKGALGFRFQFHEPLGRSYSVRYSEDLRTWLTVQSGLQGTVDFVDDDDTRRERPHVFYQVVED